jgi:aspartyl/asparaginyl beta-hydroxylase (cupin superfamily)
MATVNYLQEPDVYFLKEEKYTGIHPNYFDPICFNWVKELESRFPEILNEVAGLIYGKEEMPPNLNPPYLSSPDAWRNFYFMNFRWYNHKNCLKYPVTFSILCSIPNVSFAGITVLEPHSKVLPHIGETNAIIRCHLGLKIPGKYLECGIKVNGEERGYEQGKLLMFSDAHFHSTWNNTAERRFMLILDIIQPQFVHKGNWVCAQSLAALTIKYIDEYIRIITPLPNTLLSAMRICCAMLWWFYLPLQKRFRWFYKGGSFA